MAMNSVEEAVHKLDLEMEKEKKNPYVTVIGEYLVNFIRNNEHNAPEFLNEKKTISGAIDKMKSAARKNATRGVGMLTDEEAYNIVLKYYEVKEKPVLKAISKKKVDISLDDLF